MPTKNSFENRVKALEKQTQDLPPPGLFPFTLEMDVFLNLIYGDHTPTPQYDHSVPIFIEEASIQKLLDKVYGTEAESAPDDTAGYQCRSG